MSAAAESVLLVGDVYPPGCGGSGWSTHALALTLKERGHDVQVVALDASADETREREFEGIRVSVLGLRSARRSLSARAGAPDYSFGQTDEGRVDVDRGRHDRVQQPVDAQANPALAL